MLLSRNKWWKILMKIYYWYSFRKLLVMFFLLGASECFAASHLFRHGQEEVGHLVPQNKQATSPNILITFQPQFGKRYVCSKVLQFWSLTLPFLKPRSTARYSFWRLRDCVSSTLINWRYLKGKWFDHSQLFSSKLWTFDWKMVFHPVPIEWIMLNHYNWMNFCFSQTSTRRVSTVPIHFFNFENL